jgi:hypothetical protein
VERRNRGAAKSWLLLGSSALRLYARHWLYSSSGSWLQPRTDGPQMTSTCFCVLFQFSMMQMRDGAFTLPMTRHAIRHLQQPLGIRALPSPMLAGIMTATILCFPNVRARYQSRHLNAIFPDAVVQPVRSSPSLLVCHCWPGSSSDILM